MSKVLNKPSKKLLNVVVKYKRILKYTYLDLNLGNAHDWQCFAQSNPGTHTQNTHRNTLKKTLAPLQYFAFKRYISTVAQPCYERPNKHVTLTQRQN